MTFGEIKDNTLAIVENRRNKLAETAVFKEEYADLAEYDKIISFIKALDYTPQVKHCPMCGEQNVVTTQIDTVHFTGVGWRKKKLIKDIDKLSINICNSCGFYTIGGI